MTIAFGGGDVDVNKTETLPEKVLIIEGSYKNYKTATSLFFSNASPSQAGLWGGVVAEFVGYDLDRTVRRYIDLHKLLVFI